MEAIASRLKECGGARKGASADNRGKYGGIKDSWEDMKEEKGGSCAPRARSDL